MIQDYQVACKKVSVDSLFLTNWQKLEDLEMIMGEADYDRSSTLGHMSNLLFVLGLMLGRPHDYHINIVAWDNVLHKPLGDNCTCRYRQ